MAKTDSKYNIYNYTGRDANANIFNNEEINSKYGTLSSALSNTASAIQQNIFKNSGTPTSITNANTKTTTGTDSVYDTFRSLYPTYSASSSSSGGGGMVDISNMLRAFEQAAESNRNVAKQTYETARNDLLTSLKRFQEQNARDVANQQRTYLSNQAAIEAAIAQANRQNRISAAARGLGGSGLQQLAQLQNLLSQGQTISDIANANQMSMDDLRRALMEAQENTDNKLANALTTYNNALSSINSDLALNKANIEYQAREAAENRAAAARNTAASIEAQNQEYDKAALQRTNEFNADLSALQRQYGKELAEANSSKKVKEAKTNYENNIAELLKEYSIDKANPVYNNTYNYLSDIYNTTYNNATKIENALGLSNALNYAFRHDEYGRLKGRLQAGDLYNYNNEYLR